MLSFVYIMTPQTVVMESAWGRRNRHPCRSLNKCKILAQHIPHTQNTLLYLHLQIAMLDLLNLKKIMII